MYELIEFHDECGGGLSVVHARWLTPRKTEVFWPPYKELNKFNKAGEVIDEESSLYKIKRCFYSCDDFNKINEKLREAKETSDLQSEAEIDATLKKRKKRVTRKLYDSSDDEYATEELSYPPKIIKSLIKGKLAVNSKTPDNTLALPVLQSQETEPALPEITTPTSSRFSVLTLVSDADGEFRKKLLTLLAHIKEQNDMIIGLLNNNLSPTKSAVLPSDFPLELPIKSEVDLQLIEDYISKPHKLGYLVAFLSSLGGKDHVSKTNRILKHIIIDEVATNYNFYGHRQKKPFSVLKLKSAVVDAVKSICSATDKGTSCTL